MPSKRICVIGAGASGLPAIKSCLDEDLQVVCYERSHDIGGLWRYEDGTKEGATVYQSTFINTSKELMCYSDFPIPAEWPNFMHHSKILEYFRKYCEKFHLLDHILFHTEVVSCQPHNDDKDKWEVTTFNRRTNLLSTEIFDGILVAVGHHADPYFPLSEFSGTETFKGQIIHSKDYRTHHGYENKNVLVVGLGNSGGDIAVELSWHAKQVFLSTRRGSWIFHRVGTQGIPIDFLGITRYQSLLKKIVPTKVTERFLENLLTKKFDHAHYSLKPSFSPLNQHVTMNDDLPNRILNGSIKIKSHVREFAGDSIRFVDGTSEEIDMVVFATGFKYSFPFLENSVAGMDDATKCDLYKYMWPLSLKKPNLAIIGHFQAFGAVNPISELQCRWATRVFKGLAELPSLSAMRRDVHEKRSFMKKQYYESRRHTLEVDHVEYTNELAEQIGVKPDLLRLFFTDFQLAKKVFFEVLSPYQFRLTGPGRWSKAREMIMTQKQRMLCPLHTRPLPASVLKKKQNFKMFYFLAIFFAFLCWYYTC